MRNLTRLAVDTETTGTSFFKPYPGFHHVCKPFIVSACDDKGKTFLWRWAVNPKTRNVSIPTKDKKDLRTLFSSYDRLVFHNALFDVRALAAVNIRIPWTQVDDTMVLSHVHCSDGSHRLKDLALLHLDIPTEDETALKADVISKRAGLKRQGIQSGPSVTTDYFLSEFANHYAETDVIRTMGLWNYLSANLLSRGTSSHYQAMLSVLPSTYHMEGQGFDTIGLERGVQKFTKKCNQITKKITLQTHPDFNPNSPKQVQDRLFNLHNFPVLKTTDTGQPSTDADALEDLLNVERNLNGNDPGKALVRTILELREYETGRRYLTSYLKFRDKDGILRPHYNPTGTAGTRFSSSQPNGQNIGKNAAVSLRGYFGPTHPFTVWYAIDYDQLELRLMASLSEDTNLQKILAEGGDQHQATADALEVSRSRGKAVNFSWQYGAGNKKLARMIDMDAQDFSKKMRTAYPRILDFMKASSDIVRRQGHVNTAFGYPLEVSHESPHKGANYRVQGTAGEIVKYAMSDIWDAGLIGDRKLIRLLGNIHDELIFAVHFKSLAIQRDLKTQVPQDILDIIGLMEYQGEKIGCATPVSLTLITNTWDKGVELEINNLKPF